MPAFRIGDWLVEPTLNTLSRPGSIVRLEPKVMQVLVCLAEHPGAVASKERLLQSVWPGTFVTDDVLTRAVSELRHALGDNSREPSFIQTIPKGGYRLVADVMPAASVAADVGEATTLHPRTRGSAIARHRTAALLIAALVVLIAAVASWGTSHWLSPRPASVIGARPLTRAGRVMFPNRYLLHFPGLATDGARVYFSQGSADGSWGEELAQVSLSAGTIEAVATPFPRQILHHISSDRSKLLVQQQTTAFGLDEREGPLWALPLVGRGPLRLGDVMAHDAAWSADGNRLAFANGEALYVADWDGSNPRKLVTTPGHAYWIRWAPDDTRLRFTLTDTSSRMSLWEVRSDGTRLNRLLSGWRSDAQPCCGEWSPDGRHFVFLALEDARSDIWIKRESNGFLRTESDPGRLTSGPLNVGSVIFSRDGKQLLAVSPQSRATLNRFDLARRRIAPFGVEGLFVEFSPDRQWMAYIVPAGTLWRSRIDGSEALQLTTGPLMAGWPTWSPDGKHVAFIGHTRGGPYKLHVVSTSGGAVRQLLPGDRQEIDPSWSPDGHSIMFGRPPDVMAEQGLPKAIYILNLKGGDITTLPGSEGMFGPRWTRDGRFVVALPHKKWDRLMRFDFVTKEWSELVPYDAANTALSADGEWVYFASTHNGPHVSRARVRDGRIERILEIADVTKGTLMSCIFGAGVDLDGSPLLLCRVNATELYVLDLDIS